MRNQAFIRKIIYAVIAAILLIPLSLILGYLYYRRRSYLANVLMHSLFNGVNLWMAISTG